MLSINKFFLLVFLTVFVSCSPHGERNKSRKPNEEKLINLAVFKIFLEQVDEYKKLVKTLKAEKEIYREMQLLSYEVNRIHNEIIERQELGLSALRELKQKVEDLEFIIIETENPAKEDLVTKLEAIWWDLENLEVLIKGEEIYEEWSEEGYYIEKESEFIDQGESENVLQVENEEESTEEDTENQTPEQAPANEEAVSAIEEPAPENEEAVSAEEPAPENEEAVSAEEPAPENEEAVSAIEEQASENEEAVSAEEQASENEEAVSAEEQASENEEAVSAEEQASENEEAGSEIEEPAPANEKVDNSNEESTQLTNFP